MPEHADPQDVVGAESDRPQVVLSRGAAIGPSPEPPKRELMETLNAAARPALVAMVLVLAAFAAGQATYNLQIQSQPAVNVEGQPTRLPPALHPDAAETAQLAVQIARGGGYTTRVVRPIGLAFAGSVNKHPELSIPPVFPILESAYFRLRSISSQHAVMLTQLIYLASVLLVFVVASYWYGRPVAALASLLFLVNAEVVSMAISGRPTILTGFLVLAALAVLSPRAPRAGAETELMPSLLPEPLRRAIGILTRPCARAVLGGALIALCYLTDTFYGWLIVPAALLSRELAPSKRGWAPAVACLAAFVVLSAPWWVRSVQLTGYPFFSFARYDVLRNTADFPGTQLLRDFAAPPDPWVYALTHPLRLVRFAQTGLTSAANGLVVMLGVAVLPFAVLWFFSPAVDAAEGSRRRGVVGLAIAIAVVAMTQEAALDRFFPLVPVAAIAASWMLLRLIGRMGSLRRRAVVTGVVIAASLTLTGAMLSPAVRLPWTYMVNITMAGAELPRDTLVVSDQPWYVAWHAGLTSLWCPRDPAVARSRFLDPGLAKPAALYLSARLAADYPRDPDMFQFWGPARGVQPPAGYQFAPLQGRLRLSDALWVTDAMAEAMDASSRTDGAVTRGTDEAPTTSKTGGTAPTGQP